MNKVSYLMNSKKYIFTKDIVNNIDNNLPLSDFLLLIYFINNSNISFEPEKISNDLGLSIDEIMTSFNNLISKNIISLDSKKDKNGRIIDLVSLENFYNQIDNKIGEELNIKEKSTVFDKIEMEFNKELSPIECEIINGWLDTDYSEELILGALKEATFNGVKNLRYIDKILYEWGKKGFKTMEDVNRHLKNENNEKTEELFDYDWLNDDE